jgi:flagellar basal body-associated protein FliL
MSEEAKAAPKKKSKLPIILVLALVLGGGGFYGTQMKGKGKEKEEEQLVKLGKETIDLGEFLTNLADDRTYVRTEISIRGDEKFAAKDVEANKAAIETAVTGTLRSLTIEDLRNDRTLRVLRRRLAKAINSALKPLGESGKETEDGHTKAIKIASKEDKTEIPPDWDSATGPVLQVFTRKLATQ